VNTREGTFATVGAAAWGSLLTDRFVSADFDIRKDDFQASLRTSELSGVKIVNMRCQRHAAHRSTAHIAPGAKQEIVVAFQHAGQLTVEQDGRTANVKPGQFALYSTGRPVTIIGSDDYHSIAIRFPVGPLSEPVEAADGLTGMTFDAEHGLGQAVSGMLTGLDKALGAGWAGQASRTAKSVVGLIEELLLEQSLRNGFAVPYDSSQTLLQKCIEYIDGNLGDPTLSPARIAAANYISVRYLHVLFKKTDTSVAAYVRKQRLARTQDDLADIRRARMSVESISNAWGFTNASHFGQIFRKTTGETPAEYRHRHLGERVGLNAEPFLVL
jgi:AraC-like DNA-binding protein